MPTPYPRCPICTLSPHPIPGALSPKTYPHALSLLPIPGLPGALSLRAIPAVYPGALSLYPIPAPYPGALLPVSAQCLALVPCAVYICRMTKEWVTFTDFLPTPPLKKTSTGGEGKPLRCSHRGKRGPKSLGAGRRQPLCAQPRDVGGGTWAGPRIAGRPAAGPFRAPIGRLGDGLLSLASHSPDGAQAYSGVYAKEGAEGEKRACFRAPGDSAL